MASIIPSVHEYNVYILIRMKFIEEKLTPSSLFCYYGETNDAYLIGGLVINLTRLPSQPSYGAYVS